MKIKNGLRAASIFLTILLILPSAVSINNKESMIQGSYTNYIREYNKDIFWDNNMSYGWNIQSQYDAAISMDAYATDDFQFNLDTNINDGSSESSGEPLGKFFSVLRGWAIGFATSGKLIGRSGNIAKINFEYLSITKLKFLPPRWETANFFNISAIIFNLNQTIPHGPFDLEEDWVVAVIIKI